MHYICVRNVVCKLLCAITFDPFVVFQFVYHTISLFHTWVEYNIPCSIFVQSYYVLQMTFDCMIEVVIICERMILEIHKCLSKHMTAKVEYACRICNFTSCDNTGLDKKVLMSIDELI